MKLQTLSMLSVCGVMTCLGMGCNSAPAEPAASQPREAEPAAAPKVARDAHGRMPGEHSSMGAPIFVKLKGKKVNDTKTIVTVDLDVQHEIGYPVTMEVKLPSGAKLVKGNPREGFTSMSKGHLIRTLEVTSAKGVNTANPIKVLVKGQSANGSVGFRAEPQFPAKAELTVPRFKGKRPPAGRPPFRAKAKTQ